MPVDSVGETGLPEAGTVEGLTQAMEALNGAAGRAGQTMTTVFARGVVSGKSFDTVLRGLGQRFVDLALQAALKPLDGLVGSLAQSLTGGLGASVSGAFSGALGGVTAFADGGVVASPTYFGAPGTLGLMVNIGYIKGAEVPGVPRLPHTPAVAVYSPLSQTPVPPDTVVVAGTPAKLMLLHEAATRAKRNVQPGSCRRGSSE